MGKDFTYYCADSEEEARQGHRLRYEEHNFHRHLPVYLNECLTIRGIKHAIRDLLTCHSRDQETQIHETSDQDTQTHETSDHNDYDDDYDEDDTDDDDTDDDTDDDEETTAYLLVYGEALRLLHDIGCKYIYVNYE